MAKTKINKTSTTTVNTQNAGEVKSWPPIDEAKALKLVLGMCPEIKGDTLQNALVNLLTEYDRTKRKLAEVPTQEAGKTLSNETEILAGIKRIEESLNNVKMQFSTMRQYGVGMNGGK